jgi:hypothetical protein
MHHHQQTIADIEREHAPSAWVSFACLLVLLAGLYLAVIFCSSL